MFRKPKSKYLAKFKTEAGVNLLEYSMLASLVALMGFASVQYFGRETELKFAEIDLAMTGGNGWVNRDDGVLWARVPGKCRGACAQWAPVW